MAHLISFATTKFDASKETPNPINPIAGQGVLRWLRDELAKVGWEATEPDAEDWGWYMIVKQGGVSYLVGAGGRFEDDVPPADWMVQIHKRRSLLEKLTGRNKMAGDDSLTGAIENILRHDASFTKVEIEKDA